MRYLDDQAVRCAIGSVDLCPSLAEIVGRVAAGQVECAPRLGVGQGPLGQVTHLMLARDRERAEVVTKLIDYDPARPARSGRSSVLGMLTYMQDGEVLFTASAAAFTAIRTAACTAFAIDLLARPGPVEAVIVGTGAQAYDHALRLVGIRDVRELRIVGRSPARTSAFVARLQTDLPSLVVCGTDDVREACAGADVVITVTSAVEPVLFARDVQRGACVALVGAGVPSRREAAGDLLGIADRVVVESVDAAWTEAGDLILAAREGHLDRSATIDLGMVLGARPTWRDDEVSIYKSVGVAWEDLACARVLAARLSDVARAVSPGERASFANE